MNPTLQFISRSKHLIINNEDIEVFKSFITNKTHYGIVIGPSTSGKTTISKYIA